MHVLSMDWYVVSCKCFTRFTWQRRHGEYGPSPRQSHARRAFVPRRHLCFPNAWKPATPPPLNVMPTLAWLPAATVGLTSASPGRGESPRLRCPAGRGAGVLVGGEVG